MVVLGIETSCDETALAVFDVEKNRLFHKMKSQEDLHSIYGGVVPEIASRAHLEVLPYLFDELIKESGFSVQDIDVIAVSRGPGLLGSLLVGLGFAKGLVLATKKRLIGVDHLIAHLFVCELERKIEFPAIGLLISGGHTQLYLIESYFRTTLIGRTLDDAVGEAFDKVAKALNLPYPGGKYIDQLAQIGEVKRDIFPIPLIKKGNLDFSFSGLKTSVIRYLKEHPHIRLKKMRFSFDIKEIIDESPMIKDLCASFNWTVAQLFYTKLKWALEAYPEIKSVVVAGGVASNKIIRDTLKELEKEYHIPFIFPDPSLCTDNGIMVAYYGSILAENGFFHDLSLEAIPRGRPIPWDFFKLDRF